MTMQISNIWYAFYSLLKYDPPLDALSDIFTSSTTSGIEDALLLPLALALPPIITSIASTENPQQYLAKIEDRNQKISLSTAKSRSGNGTVQYVRLHANLSDTGAGLLHCVHPSQLLTSK